MKRGDYIRHRNGRIIGRIIHSKYHTNHSLVNFPSGVVHLCGFKNAKGGIEVRGIFEFLLKKISDKKAKQCGAAFKLPPNYKSWEDEY